MEIEHRRLDAGSLGFSTRERSYLLWGDLPPGPRLAVVGSRAAFRRDRPGVRKLVEQAGKAGWSLISGGAIGVDAWMHEAALDLGLGQLAVLPCAPDELYPPRNAELFLSIARRPGSGVLFGLERGRPQERHVFVARNEIVVRASEGVVVAQSRRRSGSVWTGRRALKLGKRVAVFAGSPGSELLQGLGAQCLGDAQAEGFAGRCGAWIRDEPFEGPSLRWPAHLQGLQQAFARQPGQGLGLEAFPEPLLAAAQLGEAMALGLVIEPRPGCYLAKG